MKRNFYDLSHLLFTGGWLGRVLPIAIEHVNAGDTWQIGLSGGLRMSPFRHFMVMDAHVHLAFYYVKHRWVYGDEWEKFIDSGYQYNSGGADALDTVTSASAGAWNFLPGCPMTGTLPAHFLRGYEQIWNHYYRVPNVDDWRDFELPGNDFYNYHVSAGSNKRWNDFGYVAARLPEFWTTGLTDTKYLSQAFAEVPASTGTGEVNLLDIAAVQGEYQSEVQRDWFDKRYRDLIKGGWGSNGVSIDADERPELLYVQEGFLSGQDINSTGDSNYARYRGKSTTSIDINIPPKYFNEHGCIWAIAVVRFPAILQNQTTYFSCHTLDYENFGGDPRVVRTKPPIELKETDFTSNGSTDSWGYHPYGQWWRSGVHTVHPAFRSVTGYPFIDAADITQWYERYYDYDTDVLVDYFQTTSDVGGTHWNLCANLDLQVKSCIPKATESIYAGAHLN